jgi:hypothetical protein
LRAGLALALAVAAAAGLHGTALAHHDEMIESASCNGWHSEADYVGGDEDRKVVVDVTVNGEHITGTFYFDAAHLGHQDSYVLYSRSGTGSVDTSGTVAMYQRGWNGQYNVLDGAVHPDLHFDASQCATPTATATSTPVATSTPPPTNTATSTPKPTRTATSTNTAVPTKTSTPRPADTPAPTETPQPSATASHGAPTSTATPGGGAEPTASSTPTSGTSSPVPTATSTEVSIVLESIRPPTSGGANPAGPGASFLPDTGLGPVADGIAAALIALAILAAVAIGLMSLGLRLRRRVS